MKEKPGLHSKSDALKTDLTNFSCETIPLFANYGLTESAIFAAGMLVAFGDPVAPAITAVACLDYIRRDIKAHRPLLI